MAEETNREKLTRLLQEAVDTGTPALEFLQGDDYVIALDMVGYCGGALLQPGFIEGLEERVLPDGIKKVEDALEELKSNIAKAKH
jgi:hypothetical protein